MAAIDVGTNSIHMIIVEAEQRGYRIIDREKEMVQLGRGSLGGEPLTEEAMTRGIAAIRTMGEIARRWDVRDIVAVATSAVREAPNRNLFLREVKKAADIAIQVISGEEEADLIFRAVRAAVDFGGETALCVDIGGGSVELIVGTGEEIYFTASEQLGSLRLGQKFFEHDPPRGKELEACRRHVKKTLKRSLSRVRSLGFDFSIGTSGTIVTLAELTSPNESAEGISAGLRWVDRDRLEDLIHDLGRLPLAERTTRMNIDPRRAESILPGAIVLHEVLDSLDIRTLRACSAALREGIVERTLSNHQNTDPRHSGVRSSSVLSLAERSKYGKAHAEQVSKLALRIFDQTAHIHELGDEAREFLGYSALLHEIGLHVAYQRHHKHSYYLIRHSGLKGFTDDQVAVIANVARYYRKAVPQNEHPNFAELAPEQRDMVRKLSAILRIADGLDRGHQQAVKDVSVDATNGTVLFEIQARNSPNLEMQSAARRAKYFARIFDRKTRFFLPGSKHQKSGDIQR